MGDVSKAQKSLSKGGTLGGETDIIFDGFSVRALTADEKKAMEKRKALRTAGEGTIEDVDSITVKSVEASREAEAKAAKKANS